MPVFRCTSCGRLLFRPGNLPGRGWRCFTCGSTTVSEAAVEVNAALAALLEKEYRLTQFRFRSSAISTSPAAQEQGEGPPLVPFWPPRPTPPLGEERRPDLTVPTAPRVFSLAGHVMCAVILIISLLGAAAILWAPWSGAILNLVVLVVVGVPSLALIVTMLVVIYGAIHHNRKLGAVDEQLQTAPPPKLDWPASSVPADATGHVQRKDDAVSRPAECD
jgi:hypothetical protein